MGRSPSGERGLKYLQRHRLLFALCRSPSGERGLKYRRSGQHQGRASRSPSGERGLKSTTLDLDAEDEFVAPHPGSVD